MSLVKILLPGTCRVLLLLVASHGVLSYNIDISSPIIITNHVDGNSSYFGSSIEFLKDGSVSWIFIGSPRASSTLLGLNGLDRPGIIWRCSFGLQPDECKVAAMDPTGSNGIWESFAGPDGEKEEIHHYRHENMLGAAMATGNSSAFVACAHNWASKRNMVKGHRTALDMKGMCYVMSKTDAVWSEEVSNLSSNSKPIQRLIPLVGRRSMQNENGWRSGQAGFSAHMTRNNELLLGAPGVRSRRGSVIVYRNNTPDGRFGNEQVIDPLIGNLFHKDSYFGYSVSSGRFFNAEEVGGHEIQYVAGAPRGASLDGSVLVFGFPKTNSSSVEKFAELQERNLGSYSYFGSVICVVDINQDGYDDLLVGAPVYSRVTLGSGSETVKRDGATERKRVVESGDEGGVFLYMSNGRELKKYSRLTGDARVGARFGFAIASAGDVNNDGYKDVVVGAPFSDESAGSIYIYHGNKYGLGSTYAQAVHARDIQSLTPLAGFGYSFAPDGVSFDRNGHSDLIVGAFLSSQAVILRTRATIKLSGRLQLFPSRLRNDSSIKPVLQSCFSYQAHETFRHPLNFTVTLELDCQTHSNILTWRNDSWISVREIVYEEVWLYKGNESCRNFTLELAKKGVKTYDPMRIRQSVSLVYNEEIKGRLNSTGPTFYEISNEGEGFLEIEGTAGFAKPEAYRFCSNCPVLANWQKDVSSLNISFDEECGNEGNCIVNFEMNAAFEGGLSPGGYFIVGSTKSVTLDVNITSLQGAALRSSVYIQFSNCHLLRVPKQCSASTVIGRQRATREKAYSCLLPFSMKAGQVEKMKFIFDMSDLVIEDTDYVEKLEFHLEVKTLRTEMAQNVTADLVLPLMYSGNVVIGGSREQVPLIETTLKEYEKLTHVYEISLDGPTPIAHFEVNLKVPVNVKISGSKSEAIEVLRPKASLDGESMYCYAVKGEFFTRPSKDKSEDEDEDGDVTLFEDKYAKKLSNSRKAKRDTHSTSEGAHSHPKNLSIIDVNCHEMTDCMEIVCRFKRISVRSHGCIRLVLLVSVNATRMLLEQASEIVGINVESVAEYSQRKRGIAKRAYASSKLYLNERKSVVIWYIIGALVGIIVLAILIVALYYCGFFNRNRPPMEEQAGVSNVPLETINDPNRSVPHENEHWVWGSYDESITSSIGETEEETGEGLNDLMSRISVSCDSESV